MVTTFQKPLFPYDLALMDESSRIGTARGRAESAPLDYSKLGGLAFQRRGDMYGSLYDAALRSYGKQRGAELSREMDWREAGRRKQALADRMKSQALANLVSGGVKLGQGAVSEASAGDEDLMRWLSRAYGGRFNPKTGVWR